MAKILTMSRLSQVICRLRSFEISSTGEGWWCIQSRRSRHTAPMSEYEKQRQQARIEANQDMLRQLGLAYTKNSICFSRLLLLHQELIDEVSRVVGVAAWAVRPSDAVVAHHRARLVAVALEEPPAAAADAQALELV